jgi:transposase
MGSTRRVFTDEFKANSVELVTGEGRSIADVSRSLGIQASTLGRWVSKATDDSGGDKPLTESEREELKRLRKEVVQARMEAEFAKKWRPGSRKTSGEVC